ncbi:unnamed protein product [Gongylonema pulchrum]|uniref:ARS2 domain-containing protein n=1 Tax=Gongylonema pulchrum TaxID=637853 RepID=A0A183EB85_9BILA|nr:unnamed protein product [Gongylonema pulchrum]
MNVFELCEKKNSVKMYAGFFFSGDEEIIKNDEEEGKQKKKMLLHKTCSIFLRNVAPNITVEELETASFISYFFDSWNLNPDSQNCENRKIQIHETVGVPFSVSFDWETICACKRFPGFLRVGLAEPVPDRKFYRRGWVVLQIKDCDLGAVINRDIARRVRSVNGVTGHKQVAQNDLRQAAKLTAIYDKKNGLYQPENAEERQSNFELDIVAQSENPLLKNLTDFLIEEASAEEEELLGISNGTFILCFFRITSQVVFAECVAEEDQKVPFQRDDQLMTRLDRIILYLRVVHSIDFYNHGEYPNEDVMPNRCGMMHVRGAPPPASQWGTDDKGRILVAQKFVTDFMAGFNNRIETALINEKVFTETELENFGRKDPEKEVEAFITANCVELAKDKWLCPLSGKKFKGPEFIRKHLTTKHAEKLENVRQEAIYFNNYLSDPKRPHNVEVKPQPSATQSAPPPREERRERERGTFVVVFF